MQRTACVTIRSADGRPFVYVTMAASLKEAVRDAVEWFNDPHWHGPKPRRETVYEVSLVGDSRTWRTRA
ncbi:MAG: hypothetical protein ABSB35_09240 [Bryobacteraceae bacterium]